MVMGVARPITHRNSKGDFIVHGTIIDNCMPVNILLDTGSACSFVNRKCLDNLHGNVYTVDNVPFRSLTDKFSMNSKIDLSLRVLEVEFHNSFYCDNVYLDSFPYDMIIGRDVLNSVGMTLNWPSRSCLNLEEAEPIDLHNDDIYLPLKSDGMDSIDLVNCPLQIKEILLCYSNVFSDHSGIMPDHFSFDVQLTTANSLRVPARRIPIHYESEIQRQMLDLEKRGIISRTTSPFSFPIVIAKKKNGDIRLCVDFRQLNKHTVKLTCDVPQFEEVRNKLYGRKVFTTLDLSQGYWHIPLTDNAKEKLCFSPSPSFGNWNFNVMPFGPKNAPGHFQRCMEKILGDLDFVFIYIDDILIFSYDIEEHCKHLSIVFDRLQKNNLHVKASKCQFVKAEVEYLGHVLKGDTYASSHKTKHVLNDYPLPTSFKELESFIGLINYYRKFVKNFAAITKRLFDFKSECNKSTRELTWTSVLIDSFNDICNLIIKATPLTIPNPDLSFTVETDSSDSAIGATLLQDGKPIQYSSRLLKKAELHYSTYEKELLAIIFALKQYYDCLIGKKFVLRCDHKPLVWIKEQKIRGRLGRWILSLQEFEFDIEHVAGTSNTVADALSRQLCTVIPEVRNFDWKMLQESLWCNDAISTDLASYAKYISVDNELVTFKGRIVVPNAIISELLKHIHEFLGHPGVQRMQDFIRTRYFWPKMFANIRQFVKLCSTCSLSKSYSYFRNREYQYIGNFPFEKISIDLKGPVHVARGGYRYIVVVKDTFSGYSCFYPLTSKDSQKVLNKVLDFMCIYGKPMAILSDGGFEFSALKSFCEKFHVLHQTTSAFHHGNGSAERTIRWLEEKLIQDPSEWPEKLNFWQFNYNFQQSATSGLSPNDIIFSYHTRHVHDFDTPKYLLDDRPVTHERLKVGDYVLVKNSLRKKGSPYYLEDKFEVIGIKGQSVTVKCGRKVMQRHITFLKPFAV